MASDEGRAGKDQFAPFSYTTLSQPARRRLYVVGWLTCRRRTVVFWVNVGHFFLCQWAAFGSSVSISGVIFAVLSFPCFSHINNNAKWGG